MQLWVISVFTFANRRKTASSGKEATINVKDLVFQLYFKPSGLGVLGWIGLLMANAAWGGDEQIDGKDRHQPASLAVFAFQAQIMLSIRI